MVYLVMCVVAFVGLMFVQIPALYQLFNVQPFARLAALAAVIGPPARPQDRMDPTAAAEMTAPATRPDAEPPIVEPRRRDFALGWIILGAIAVRLLLWLWCRDLPIRIYDENDYDTLARNLVARGE